MKKLTITRFPKPDYACEEAINTLCTNLSYCGKDIQVVLITSRYENEGKSSIAMNLMRTLASFGKRVVLLDADLRRSILDRRYRFRYPSQSANGLAQYLSGMCPLDDVLYATDIPNACIIPAGRKVLNSMQLLTSPLYGQMLDALRKNFDTILVDTPPAGVIVDAVEIAKYCDGALLVVSYNVGRKREIGDVTANIAKSGCKVLGAVMNNVDMHAFRNRRFYYRSGLYSTYYSHYDKGYREGRKASPAPDPKQK